MATGAGFKLPAWRSLSPEQEKIVTLPYDEDYVVKGSPGTGKTVMALYRAATISRRENYRVNILVYNRPLMMYMKEALIGDSTFENVNICTYHTWIREFYKQQFDKEPPMLDKYEPDWERILYEVQKIPNRISYMIIDEAQDFPIELMKVIKYVSKYITCFIDPNQAIVPGKTQVADALIAMAVECPYTLKKNYRNTKEIAELSKLYWNGEGKFAEPDPRKQGTKPWMVKCIDFDDQLNTICSYIRDNLALNIGVLTNGKSLKNVYEHLSNELEGEIDVQVFKTQSSITNLDFSKRGVKIFSYGTMKGLEFDLVLIMRWEGMKSTGSIEADNNRAYVAITRASNDLKIMYYNTRSVNGNADIMPPIVKNENLCTWYE